MSNLDRKRPTNGSETWQRRISSLRKLQILTEMLAESQKTGNFRHFSPFAALTRRQKLVFISQSASLAFRRLLATIFSYFSQERGLLRYFGPQKACNFGRISVSEQEEFTGRDLHSSGFKYEPG